MNPYNWNNSHRYNLGTLLKWDLEVEKRREHIASSQPSSDMPDPALPDSGSVTDSEASAVKSVFHSHRQIDSHSKSSTSLLANPLQYKNSSTYQKYNSSYPQRVFHLPPHSTSQQPQPPISYPTIHGKYD